MFKAILNFEKPARLLDHLFDLLMTSLGVKKYSLQTVAIRQTVPLAKRKTSRR